ncbi:hypothetical protein LAZ67_4001366 [Cordylochernes scorpioides]|uniref:Uncharacterized protein n=1 Tax=Cordylochernes scorpioides TaxID=51811 RepID=A0ABY6KC58_9ARAC|nr:hypothetical protein LAZ67_4001366 [Cordylochernes scorpioides]
MKDHLLERPEWQAIYSSRPIRASLVANLIKVLNRAPYIRLCWTVQQELPLLLSYHTHTPPCLELMLET